MADSIAPASLVAQTREQPCDVLVVKYVDFSSKYGLGYRLSNGSYGVLFNDSTKIIILSDGFHFAYIERVKQANLPEEVLTVLSFYDYPDAINKKVVLLQHFKSYLEGNSKFKPI
jgi:polo-like kinase 1